jgi:hypothetical protein
MEGFDKPVDSVIMRLLEDDKNRQQKLEQMQVQQLKAEDELVSKVMQPDIVAQKTRTHD